jgi:hypothetical protein
VGFSRFVEEGLKLSLRLVWSGESKSSWVVKDLAQVRLLLHQSIHSFILRIVSILNKYIFFDIQLNLGLA